MAQETGWNETSLNVLGRTIEGVVEFSYKETEEHEYVRGRGGKPIGMVTGNYSVEGSFTLLRSEFVALRDAARTAGKRLTQISFDIIHSYENEGGVAVTDIVVGARIKENENKLAQGDKMMKIALPYIALDLKPAA